MQFNVRFFMHDLDSEIDALKIANIINKAMFDNGYDWCTTCFMEEDKPLVDFDAAEEDIISSTTANRLERN